MEQGPDGGTFGDEGFDGTRRIMICRKCSSRISNAPTCIRASIPVDTAVENAKAVLVSNLVLFSPFMLFGFFVAWLIGKCAIVDRVATLQAASQRLAAGDLQTRVADLVTGGELKRLAQSFDTMARELATRDQSLRDSEEHYRLLIENSPNMIMIHCEGKITFINTTGPGCSAPKRRTDRGKTDAGFRPRRLPRSGRTSMPPSPADSSSKNWCPTPCVTPSTRTGQTARLSTSASIGTGRSF